MMIDDWYLEIVGPDNVRGKIKVGDLKMAMIQEAIDEITRKANEPEREQTEVQE